MATTADFKNGLYLKYNDKPCMIVWFQHVKPGKGPAFVKTKLRNLENGRILENTFTAGAKIETIDVERRPYQFLYAEEDGFNFMHEETYEQIKLPKDVVENSDLMKEGQHVEMMFVTGDLFRARRQGQHRLHFRPQGSSPGDRRQDHGPALHQHRRCHHGQHYRPFLRPESLSTCLCDK